MRLNVGYVFTSTNHMIRDDWIYNLELNILKIILLKVEKKYDTENY
jgi:hypothetical protein